MGDNSDRRLSGHRGDRSADAFDRAVADLGKRWEDDFGALCSWEALSSQSKVGYLAAYAAVHDVSFEHFAEAAQEAVGAEAWRAADPWSLRGQYEGARGRLVRGGPPAEGVFGGAAQPQCASIPAQVSEAERVAFEKALAEAEEGWTLRGQYEGARVLFGPDDPPANDYDQALDEAAERGKGASQGQDKTRGREP